MNTCQTLLAASMDFLPWSRGRACILSSKRGPSWWPEGKRWRATSTPKGTTNPGALADHLRVVNFATRSG